MKCIVTAKDGTRRREVEASDEAEAATVWARQEWRDMGEPWRMTCIVTEANGDVWQVVIESEMVPSFEVVETDPVEDQ
jgi:hypothetical protein